MLIGCCSMPVYAKENETTSDTIIEYFDDGSYAIITITEYENISKASSKTASKTYTHKSSNDETLWTYTITGTFSYTGSSSTCTSVTDSYTISNDYWHMDSHSCSRSGNSAYGTVTMKRKFLGITTDTISRNLTLSCSATGVLS